MHRLNDDRVPWGYSERWSGFNPPFVGKMPLVLNHRNSFIIKRGTSPLTTSCAQRGGAERKEVKGEFRPRRRRRWCNHRLPPPPRASEAKHGNDLTTSQLGTDRQWHKHLLRRG